MEGIGPVFAKLKWKTSPFTKPRIQDIMITPTTNSLLLGCFALATGTLLTNCVEPYGQVNRAQVRPATYRSGYEIRSLPPGYRTETIAGTRYYNHNGTYYRPQPGGYVVVEAPRSRYGSSVSRYDRPDSRYSETVTQLPRGYREVDYCGNRYYQSNDVYYQQRGSGYIPVERPY